MVSPITPPVSVEQAAKDLCAPKAVVERVAADLGLLILFGNRKRIHPDDYQEIIDVYAHHHPDHQSDATAAVGRGGRKL